MYCVAKILGSIYANPPYHVLRCMVATERETYPIVVKGKIAGPVPIGGVMTFSAKEVMDKKTLKPVLEVVRNPINPSYLKNNALTQWVDWSDTGLTESLEVLSCLTEAGVPSAMLNSIWKEVEADPSMIKRNPWYLIYKGMDFNTTDNIAKTLLGEAFEPKSSNRIEGAIFWSLLQGLDNGQSYLDANAVFRDVNLLTGVEDAQEIAKGIKAMKDAQPPRIVVEKLSGLSVGNALYLPSYHKMEVEVATEVLSPIRRDVLSVAEVMGNRVRRLTDDEIRGYSKFALTDKQLEAVRLGLESAVSIVTGLPGTGKTTILSVLCRCLEAQGERVLLVAPTGIAAKRAGALTGMESMTIHRAFGAGGTGEDKGKVSDYEGVKKVEGDEVLKGSISASIDPSSEVWKHNRMNPRGESVVIIDEASMVDLHQMWRVMCGITERTRVVLVGDIAQLPPVGAGFVLADLLSSTSVPRVHLSEIFRQGEGSGVTLAAHSIHAGKIPEQDTNLDFEFIELYRSQDILDKILDISRELQLEGVDFHVMSPTHHGLLGVTNLNKELRSVLNPSSKMTQSLQIGSGTYRMGDKIMITRNDYDLGVYNGDIGRIVNINRASVEVILKGVVDQRLDLPLDELSKLLRLAYATTVHKAQGQEYHTIVMPMCLEHGNNLLLRSLLYTAVTRAKIKVYLVGDKQAMIKCVLNANTGTRYSRLKDRLEAK